MTCGPASARMLLARRGIHWDEAALARCLGTDPHGTRPWHMLAGLHALGCQVRRGDGGVDGLRAALAAGRDALVCYEIPDHGVDHYALVRGLDQHSVTLCDPLRGAKHRIRRSSFERDWVGTAWHGALVDGWWLDVARGHRHGA